MARAYSFNGKTEVSKTFVAGSSPAGPAHMKMEREQAPLSENAMKAYKALSYLNALLRTEENAVDVDGYEKIIDLHSFTDWREIKTMSDYSVFEEEFLADEIQSEVTVLKEYIEELAPETQHMAQGLIIRAEIYLANQEDERKSYKRKKIIKTYSQLASLARLKEWAEKENLSKEEIEMSLYVWMQDDFITPHQYEKMLEELN